MLQTIFAQLFLYSTQSTSTVYLPSMLLLDLQLSPQSNLSLTHNHESVPVQMLVQYLVTPAPFLHHVLSSLDRSSPQLSAVLPYIITHCSFQHDAKNFPPY